MSQASVCRVCGAAESAEHRTDEAGAGRTERVEERAADHRTGEAVHTADDQHGERNKGDVEIERARRQHADEVGMQDSTEAYDKGADDEGDQAFAANIYPGRQGRHLVLPRGAQSDSVSRVLIGEGQDKREHCVD